MGSGKEEVKFASIPVEIVMLQQEEEAVGLTDIGTERENNKCKVQAGNSSEKAMEERLINGDSIIGPHMDIGPLLTNPEVSQHSGLEILVAHVTSPSFDNPPSLGPSITTEDFGPRITNFLHSISDEERGGSAGSDPIPIRVQSGSSDKRKSRFVKFRDFRKVEKFPNICGEKRKSESEERFPIIDFKKLKKNLTIVQGNFENEEEGRSSEKVTSVLQGIGSLHLKPGILRLQPWTQNFNPNTQRTTNAQIWARFYDLPWEFWHPQILSDMARGVGIPLKFDRATLEGDYGHFARMLIDVDLSKPLPDSIMIEVGEDCLFLTLYFENVPSAVDCGSGAVGVEDCVATTGGVTVEICDGLARPPESSLSESERKLKLPYTENSFVASNSSLLTAITKVFSFFSVLYKLSCRQISVTDDIS
ncbi:hypothetical protein LWI29_027805 [Acer saccharum]|uniref:DUF4283 domain-containing protein n=1 Tax=Acer saccharum TaxID=4024 RepID=A0AA39VJ71_ACESA|nr:hypothetical protein LWI29_027805 [Acer saccharum]